MPKKVIWGERNKIEVIKIWRVNINRRPNRYDV